MKRKQILIISIMLLSLFRCNEKDNKKDINRSFNLDQYNENNYNKTQGIVLKKVRHLKRKLFNSPEKSDIYYIYNLHLAQPLIGVEKDSKLMYDEDDLIAVMVHKKVSAESFIGHRGIVDQELLYTYLTRIDSNYYKMKDQVNFK